MAFTVFIYEDNENISHESFKSIHDAFTHIGKLELGSNGKVSRCILDSGFKILFDLHRDDQGFFTTN